MDLLPDEQILYFGDTARGPYGPRDLDEVRKFTGEIVGYLSGEDTKLVVAACNTATAAALDPSAGTEVGTFPVPVVGVIQPAVVAAAATTRNGRIGVIGTVGTVRSASYDRAVAALAPDVELVSQACPRFVELVEGGRTTDAEVLETATAYLRPLRQAGVDTLILGCTHYPLLTGVLSYVMGSDVVLVSSAEETARQVFATLIENDLMASGPRPAHRLIASGDGTVFAHLATRFLGPRLSEVEAHPDGESVRHVPIPDEEGLA